MVKKMQITLNQVERMLKEIYSLAIREANHQRAIRMEFFTPQRRKLVSCSRMDSHLNYITRIHETRGSEMELLGELRTTVVH